MSVTSETSSSPASPHMESCCYIQTGKGKRHAAERGEERRESGLTYCDIHALLSDQLETTHHVLLHLDELGQLLGKIRAKGTGGVLAECMS